MSFDSHDTRRFDAVIIGGGFYGCAIAVYLAEQRGLRNILLVEREAALFTRASYNNQARVHNGYHYPRSFTTAYRSRVNLPRFVRDHPTAIKKNFTKLYAFARRNSKVSARQFVRFCREIGARLEPADIAFRQLFEPRLIEDIFVVEEYAFDAAELAKSAVEELDLNGVQVEFKTAASDISTARDGGLEVGLKALDGERRTVRSRYVFNCAYSGLNQIGGEFPGTVAGLKHEITEMALLRVASPLAELGVTVMDGPFFSMMPFPARELHTLSHVRYTPHLHWSDQHGVDPYDKLNAYGRETRVDRMLRDVGRYMPAIQESEYVESLFEVKTILAKNEVDDGRPILFEKHPELPGCFSVLGGKIDNIYDVLERLAVEEFA